MSKFIKREVGVPVSHAIVSNLIPIEGDYYNSIIKDEKVVIIDTKKKEDDIDLEKELRKKTTKTSSRSVEIKKKTPSTKVKTDKLKPLPEDE